MFFQTEPVCPGMTRIWDVAHTAMYLVEGSEKAVLIDTGVGVGNLKALVDKLTQKPVTVLITHGHVDHAMGAGQFDSVYMSPLDEAVYLGHSSLKSRKSYVLGNIHGQNAAITDNDYAEPLPFSAFLPLQPGDCFDLGGVSIQVLQGRGHTPGSVTFLLPEWKLLLLGDACNDFTFLFLPEASTVAEYREMLSELRKRTEGTFERVLFSHGSGEGDIHIIDEVIAVCDQILRRETDDIPFRGMGGIEAFIAKAMNFEKFCREDGHPGNIVYSYAKLP